jgi:hypothetical protein
VTIEKKSTNNDKPKKPSKPWIKRHIFCEVELGPYFGGEDRRRYVSWWAELPGNRGVCAVQRVTEPKRLGDEKRNPVLFKHTYDTSYLCGMDGHQKVTILTGHALYLAVKEDLDRLTRPVVKVHGEGAQDWETLDIGGCAETIGRWKEQVLQTLSSSYCVRDFSEYVQMLKEVETQQEAEQRADNTRGTES